MLWTPHQGDGRTEDNTGDAGTLTPGTSVTTGGAAGTKGAVSELIASTGFDSFGMWIWSYGFASSAAASDLCVDILTGSSTEEVLIANLLLGYNGSASTTGGRVYYFPLYVPAGTRLSCQAAGRRTSTAFQVAIFLEGGNGSPRGRVGTRVTTYGVSSVPNGTAVTPGASGAEGSWTEIAASSSEDHFAIMSGFQVTNDSGVQVRAYQLDIGTGAATEEKVGHHWYATDLNETVVGPYPSGPLYKEIPSGTRLVARLSNSGTNSDTCDVALYGVS